MKPSKRQFLDKHGSERMREGPSWRADTLHNGRCMKVGGAKAAVHTLTPPPELEEPHTL